MIVHKCWISIWNDPPYLYEQHREGWFLFGGNTIVY